MSFYVTLPSNSSISHYPDNTLTKFTTKLHQTLQLEGSYEVALSEIMFPYNWIPSLNLKIEIGRKNADTNVSVELDISSKFNKFKNMTYLVESINQEINSKGYKSSFNYNEMTNRVRFQVAQKEFVVLPEATKEFFGFDANYFEVSAEATVSRPKQINNINTLFVYCDCIDYQYIGDTYAPLLRVVAVPNELQYGDNVNLIFDSPHYVPVSRNTINTIEISLLDDIGELIQFNYGKVIIKLHFRPKLMY